jgi:hypothetical protein
LESSADPFLENTLIFLAEYRIQPIDSAGRLFYASIITEAVFKEGILHNELPRFIIETQSKENEILEGGNQHGGNQNRLDKRL